MLLHMMTILSIPKLKAKISHTDYCQLVDVLYKNLSTLDQDLYSNQENSDKKDVYNDYISSPSAKKTLFSTTMGNQKLYFHLLRAAKYILGLFR